MKSLMTVLLLAVFGLQAGAQECTMNFVDLDQEDPGVKEAIYREIALSQIPNNQNSQVVFKKVEAGRLAAAITLGSGNDYVHLYYVVLDADMSDVFMAHKLDVAANRIQLENSIGDGGRFDTLGFTVTEVASVENEMTSTSFDLTLHIKDTSLDAESCVRR